MNDQPINLHDPVRQPGETQAQYDERKRKSRFIGKVSTEKLPHHAGSGRPGTRKTWPLVEKGPSHQPKAKRVRERKHKKEGAPVIGAMKRLRVERPKL